MTRRIPDSQVAGLKAHADTKHTETVDKINKAIDRLKKRKEPINFETVRKEAGVARATLYKDEKIKERILGLRESSRASPLEAKAADKGKASLKDEKIVSLRNQVKKLEEEKRKLVLQLIDYEEIKAENERLRRQLMKET